VRFLSFFSFFSGLKERIPCVPQGFMRFLFCHCCQKQVSIWYCFLV
jgi:hypothetical protein